MNAVKIDKDLEKALSGEFKRSKKMKLQKVEEINLTNEAILEGKTKNAIPRFTISKYRRGNVNYFAYYFNAAGQKALKNKFNCDIENFAIAISTISNSCAISFAESKKPYERVNQINVPKEQREELNKIFNKLSFDREGTYSFRIKFYPNKKTAYIDLENSLI